MKLHIVLKIKFRAFGITFANISETWDLPLPFAAVAAEQNLLNYSERGAMLLVGLIR